MDQKDVAATVLSSLSLVVSVLTALLGFFYWCHERKEKAKEDVAKAQQRVMDVKDSYRLVDIASSVREVAEVLQHHQGSEHLLWNALYQRQPAILSVSGSLQRRELLQHLSKVDSYWDYVIDMHSKNKLPGLFHTDGGWLARADNYRRLFEPLFIANYCQFEKKTPYLAVAGDGSPLKRPKRYWYIEQLWADMEPGKPQYDSTVWAAAYEQQHQAEHQAPISMQGVPPVRLRNQ